MSDERNRVARALCAEECAAFGDPPCWRVVDDWGPNNCCDGDGPNCFTRADAALAEIGGVRVRELVWEYHPAGTIAAPPTGHAYIIDTRMKGRVHSIKGFNPQREFVSLDEAKAAAQADYEARILAAIEPAPVTKNRPPASADWMDGPGTGPAPVSVREAAIDTAASKALFGYMDRSDRYSCGVQAGVSRMCAALRAIAEGKDDE